VSTEAAPDPWATLDEILGVEVAALLTWASVLSPSTAGARQRTTKIRRLRSAGS
jgi:hypothetical protein